MWSALGGAALTPAVSCCSNAGPGSAEGLQLSTAAAPVTLANTWAALLGVPAYASNLTALPMLSGLLAQGMSRSAALAFLIFGPTTTLPAMAAVWGLTSRRIFALYVSFSLVGAVVLRYVHSLVTGLF